MKKHITKLLAAVAMTWLSGSAIADEPCVTCAPEPVARGGWYASAGVLYLKQVGGSNTAFSTDTYSAVDPVTGQSELLSTSLTNFSQNYKWSGRAEIGVKDASGFGLRARFFWINDSSSIKFTDAVGDQTVISDADPLGGTAYNTTSGLVFNSANALGINMTSVGTASAPSDVTFSRRLKLRAYDFDVTSDCRRGCLETTWFAGIRYMTIDQNYDATETVLSPDLIEHPNVIPIAQNFTSQHSLQAWGPTVGVEGRYPILDSLKGFAGARFGILYAEGPTSASLVLTPRADAAFQVANTAVVGNRCLGLPIGELELGAEYSRVLGCDGPELFIRGSVLGLAYWGAGNAARVNSSNEPANEDLYFFGFSATIGIRY